MANWGSKMACAILIAGVVIVGNGHAQPTGGGGVVIRVADGRTPRCIDASQDRVWITLRRLVTTKSQNWFTEDRNVAVIINAQVRTDPQPARPLSFPLMTEMKFENASAGQVSIPIEYSIVRGLALTQSDTVYAGIGLEVTLLNLKDRTGLGAALQTLGTITSSSKLPLPSSPYVQGASYLLDFINTAISQDMQKHNSNDKVKSASLEFNFDPLGECYPSNDFETTGTKAIIYAGHHGTGAIDIRFTNDYCWTAELTPAFVLKTAPKDASVPCEDTSYGPKYQTVTNNYLGFYVNKQRIARQLGPSTIAQRDRQESVARCAENGVSAGECLRAE